MKISGFGCFGGLLMITMCWLSALGAAGPAQSGTSPDQKFRAFLDYWNQNSGASAIHYALNPAYDRSSPVIEALIDAGADVLKSNGLGNPLLHQAVEWQKINIIPIICTKNYYAFSSRVSYRRTALHQAADMAHNAMIDKLLEQSNTVKYFDHRGDSPLSLYLKKIFELDKDGHRVVTQRNDQADVDMVKRLTGNDLDLVEQLFAIKDYWQSPYDFVRRQQDAQFNNIMPQIIQYFDSLRNSEKALLKEGSPESKLMKIFQNEKAYLNLDDVQSIINQNSKIRLNFRYYYHDQEYGFEVTRCTTPLNRSIDLVGRYCQETSNLESTLLPLIQRFIQKEVDVDRSDYEGNTPLHIALSWGLGGTVEILLNSGADVCLRNRESLPPLAVPCSEIIQYQIPSSSSYAQLDLLKKKIAVYKEVMPLMIEKIKDNPFRNENIPQGWQNLNQDKSTYLQLRGPVFLTDDQLKQLLTEKWKSLVHHLDTLTTDEQALSEAAGICQGIVALLK